MEFVDLTSEVRRQLIIELLSMGTLEDQYKESDEDPTRDEVLCLLKQGLDALQYLYDKRLAHRDIKPANITMVSRDLFSIGLSDFGFSKDITLIETIRVTHLYTTPEIAKHINSTAAHRIVYTVLRWMSGSLVSLFSSTSTASRLTGNTTLKAT